MQSELSQPRRSHRRMDLSAVTLQAWRFGNVSSFVNPLVHTIALRVSSFVSLYCAFELDRALRLSHRGRGTKLEKHVVLLYYSYHPIFENMQAVKHATQNAIQQFSPANITPPESRFETTPPSSSKPATKPTSRVPPTPMVSSNKPPRLQNHAFTSREPCPLGCVVCGFSELWGSP